MKQVIEIQATDGETRLRLKAEIQTDGRLTRDEAKRIREQWAERLMLTIPGLRYTEIPTHRVRVK